MLVLSGLVLFGVLRPFEISRFDFDKTYFDNNNRIVPIDTVYKATDYNVSKMEEKLESDSLFEGMNKLNLLFGKKSKVFALSNGYTVKYEYDDVAALYIASFLVIFCAITGILSLFTSIRFYIKRKEIYKKLISEIKRMDNKP